MNRQFKHISYGDRIFARVTRNGRTILNFMTEKVSNMTELLGELRMAMKGLKGLVMLHIRNYHRGWGEERPLMLYEPQIPDYARSVIMPGNESRGNYSSKKMLSPWEVH